MTRKGTLARQKPLGEAQTREGLKVLKKFVERKYRLSIASLSDDNLDSTLTDLPSPTKSTEPSAFGAPQVTFSYDRLSSIQQPALSTGFASTIGLSNFHPNSVVEADFLDIPVQDGNKCQKNESTFLQAFRKVQKFLKQYKNEMNNVFLVILLVVFALAGGVLFYHLEADAEKKQNEDFLAKRDSRQKSFAFRIKGVLKTDLCQASSDELRQFEEEVMDNCTQLIMRELNEYEKNAGITVEPNGWEWDYWNAVFYAGTVFTTIGYGTPHCKTVEGRAATIIYALIGVPFMLIVLNSIGKFLYHIFQQMWEGFQRRLKKRTRYVRRKLFTQEKMELAKSRSLEPDWPDDPMLNSQSSDSEDIFETFPLSLALFIIVVYVALCSVVFSYWEEWDFGTSFYFFFISLMTIGFGDEMPAHPHNACAFFIFFIIGLALFSMCLSIMQMRVENRYMAALNLIDEEQKRIPQPILPPDLDQEGAIGGSVFDGGRNPSLDFFQDSGPVRWRSQKSTDEMLEENGECPARSPYGRMSSVISIPGSEDIISPVLGVFIARSKSTRASRKSLNRLNSMQGGSRDNIITPIPGTPGSTRRSVIFNPSVEPVDGAPVDNCGKPTDLSTSTPNVVSPQSSLGTRSALCTAPLSVITESTEEEHSENDRPKSKKRRRPPPLKAAAAVLEDGILELESEEDSQ